MDFEYTTLDDSTHSLSELGQEYILIYFHSPECPDCDEIKARMIKDKKIRKWIEEDRLTILAILPDVDKTYWQFFYNIIPDNWINGWIEDDEEIITAYLYTVPTLFLIRAKTLEIIGYDISFRGLKRLLR